MVRIYVGNLSYQSTVDEIRDAFSEYGEVSTVDIVTEPATGRSRGFAFVEMPSASEANAAIDGLNEQDVGGRRLIVNEARPRPPRREGGGGGGGGGYRGGGNRGGGGGGGGDRSRSNW